MTKDKDQIIQRKLERVFRKLSADAGPASRDKRTADFIFHMTDWQHDLEKLSSLYKSPTGASDSEWQSAVEAFLYHAVGHLFAAAKLNGYVPDPFKALPKATPKRAIRAHASAK